MDPDIDNFNIYTTFPIICGFLYSLTMIIQKKTSAKDNLFSQVFHIYIAAISSSLIMVLITGNGTYNDPLNDNFQFAWHSILNLRKQNKPCSHFHFLISIIKTNHSSIVFLDYFRNHF